MTFSEAVLKSLGNPCPVWTWAEPYESFDKLKWWEYLLFTQALVYHNLCKFVCGFNRMKMCVCVCGHVYVVYEDTNLYNDMGMTYVLQGEGDLWGHFQCPHNLKRL